MLLAILQMKKSSSDLASDLWPSLNLWGSKVHCPAVTFGWVQGGPSLPQGPPPLWDFSKPQWLGWGPVLQVEAVARGQSPTHTLSGPIVLAG